MAVNTIVKLQFLSFIWLITHWLGWQEPSENCHQLTLLADHWCVVASVHLVFPMRQVENDRSTFRTSSLETCSGSKCWFSPLGKSCRKGYIFSFWVAWLSVVSGSSRMLQLQCLHCFQVYIQTLCSVRKMVDELPAERVCQYCCCRQLSKWHGKWCGIFVVVSWWVLVG